MYRCATVTQAELEEVRRIRAVIRLGHARRIDAGTLVLDGGELQIAPGTLHVDCAADALAQRTPVPIFAPDRMTLQSVRTCQQVFSAALLAKVETTFDDDALKNDLCWPVPHPDSGIDWLRTVLATGRNEMRWAALPELHAWLNRSRLQMFPEPDTTGIAPTTLAAAAQDARAHAEAQARKLTELLVAAGEPIN